MRWLILVLAVVMAGAAFAAELPYPQGKAFPLGLYSIGTAEEMQKEAGFGWNIAHTYSMKPEYLEIVKSAGWFALAHLNKGDEAATAATIKDLVGRGPIAWWDFPEEMRYWEAEEYQVVKDAFAWTRKYDPQQRPNFMYIANHYRAEAIAKYMPYLDIIGAGTYTEYAHMPRGWVRWRVEETIKSIEAGGAKIGPNYLAGEKTPIGIPMLFGNPDTMRTMGPVEAYHDFYSCLASGAKGILIFSYWHKRDVAVLQKAYDAYAKGAREVSGPEGLGQALLFGEDVKLSFEITDGPQQTYAFRPTGMDADVCYPSLNVLAKRYQGTLYVIAVNSSERGIKVKVSGVPGTVAALTLPFEKAMVEGKPTEQQRSVAVKDGAFEDAVGWLGVHVYTAKVE
ncbi:MAG: hypothetical protein ACYC63_17535 [Armatimonadota bacterium]